MTSTTWSDQGRYDVRFEWGPVGLDAVGGDVVVIVDVLRFTTAIDAAVGRGAFVHPYRWRDATAATFAARIGAELAASDGDDSDSDDDGWPSLSPVGLLRSGFGDRIVLPSPNGATCAVRAAETGATVVAACLRNATAVARWVERLDWAGTTTPRVVSVVACGERWPDDTLRPCLEDLLGAGAVIDGLGGARHRSPEADAAAAAWVDARPRIGDVLAACSSGRELLARGREDDLAFASEVDVSGAVPMLRNGAFVDARPTPPA